MDYQNFFAMRHIECQKGLSIEEISHIEDIYNIFFQQN